MLDVRGQWLGVVFAALGALAAASWRRLGRPYMLLHGAAYVVAAGIVSGAFTYAAWALLATPDGGWRLPSVVVLLVAIASAVPNPIPAFAAPAGFGVFFPVSCSPDLLACACLIGRSRSYTKKRRTTSHRSGRPAIRVYIGAAWLSFP